MSYPYDTAAEITSSSFDVSVSRDKAARAWSNTACRCANKLTTTTTVVAHFRHCAKRKILLRVQNITRVCMNHTRRNIVFFLFYNLCTRVQYSALLF